MNAPIENPLRHFAEAAQSARYYMEARKEHLVIAAEQLAAREARRAAWGAAGLVFAHLALILTFFWLTYTIHEQGVAPGWIALGSFVFIGGIAVFCTWFSQHEHSAPHTFHLKSYGAPGRPSHDRKDLDRSPTRAA